MAKLKIVDGHYELDGRAVGDGTRLHYTPVGIQGGEQVEVAVEWDGGENLWIKGTTQTPQAGHHAPLTDAVGRLAINPLEADLSWPKA